MLAADAARPREPDEAIRRKQRTAMEDLEIGSATAEKYIAMRKEVDRLLWSIASLASILRMLREIPGPIEMDNHAIGRVGEMIEGNAYDIFDQLNNGFASASDVKQAMEKLTEAHAPKEAPPRAKAAKHDRPPPKASRRGKATRAGAR